ncbi:hypothetical protein ACIPPR_33725 [Streptomyces nigra]|uniref:hypothetical protein n=1 Tax=Streptomyces nigra TaxID=1827580 RepID=UPI0037F6CBF2
MTDPAGARPTDEAPDSSKARHPRRPSDWQIRQHLARGLAYGIGSGAVSLLVLWVQSGGLGK